MEIPSFPELCGVTRAPGRVCQQRAPHRRRWWQWWKGHSPPVPIIGPQRLPRRPPPPPRPPAQFAGHPPVLHLRRVLREQRAARRPGRAAAHAGSQGGRPGQGHPPHQGKPLTGSCLKTGQHSIFAIIRKIKRIIHVCWIPYLLKIL